MFLLLLLPSHIRGGPASSLRWSDTRVVPQVNRGKADIKRVKEHTEREREGEGERGFHLV